MYGRYQAKTPAAKTTRRLVFGLSISAVLAAPAGCSAFSAAERGYYEGCQSGYVDAGDFYNSYVKDEDRFRNDAEYRKNWQAGHDACYSRQKATPRLDGWEM